MPKISFIISEKKWKEVISQTSLDDAGKILIEELNLHYQLEDLKIE